LTELGRRLASGDAAAFAELYDRCADRLHHWLVLRLGSRADADDVLQESFVRLARTRKKLAGVESPTAYLFAIARNEALRLLARRSRDSRARSSLAAGDLFCQPADAGLEAAEAADALTAALDKLPVEQREVVELKTYGGLTLAEIAQVTGAPPGTVATRWRAAVARLKEILARQCHE
jgi:RNA polymerase sigma-70 factor, ECF subfamily